MLGAAAVSAVLPILVYLWPYSKSKQGMKIDIKLSEALGQLKDNVPIKFNAPTGKAFVLASGGGDNAVGDPPSQGGSYEAARRATRRWSSRSTAHI